MKLAVCIMAKNESLIIERCLKSIIPIANLVILTDTGSTDDTIIKAGLFLQLHQIPYKIYKESFIDFSFNRNKLLELTQNEPIDYVLMIDCDEILEICDEFKLDKDFYNIPIKAGTINYCLPRLTSNKVTNKYQGVTHEYFDTTNLVGETLNQLIIHQYNDGNRRINNKKFVEDSYLLEKAMQETNNETLKGRYTFYLAQTYQNLHNLAKSKEYYLKTIEYKGWIEEVFYSYYQLGNIFAAENSNECLYYYQKAYEILPTRIESLAAMRKFLWKRIIETPLPEQGLFIEYDKYGKN